MKISPSSLEAQVIQSLVSPAGKKILQVGCWSGREMQALLCENTQLTGIELRQRRYQEIKDRFPQVEMIRADYFDVELVESFDAVVFSSCLHHFKGGLDRKIEALHKARRMLTDEGKILVIEPAMDNVLCQLAELFISERQGIIQAFSAMHRSDLEIVRHQRVVVDYSFVDFDDLCREFFMADGYHVLKGHVVSIREYLEIEDENKPIFFSSITNLYILQ
ncbi:class I SAM-dependent methyltransferase [Candidatus Falkowbacteria bacterium]|jgi:SAM-dependent methyltransferase|nr:class I SAM-dependent methyltransferase [Candidatus Falkowbacteria bacterium]MBT5503199.1 class I SAM-dependent methyltransferase [Candidatus Falkowbacteria bacterium]MBT6573894.1 class I SAM-dependent methyltransferase [Candidatus Falkowbacteria bacterium]MBT7348499.1 class I SAM-dependent methyltransferase [Candidatus Falkowbacteria bacterium]MBT7500836.1 class I SAM-dependent methyltransferase [Candidatus Falkowbacteria bacterium]